MFDIDKAIAEWRRQASASGIANGAVLDELEGHLLDGVDEQVINGLSPEQAFQIAVQQIGSATSIKREFNKNTPMKAKNIENIMGGAGFSVYALIAIYALFFGTTLNATWCEKALGLCAVILTGASLLASSHVWRVLPVIRIKKVRMSVAIAIALLGVFVTYMIVNVVMPKLDLTLAQIAVTILWALQPLVIGSVIFGGLIEAAERRSTAA